MAAPVDTTGRGNLCGWRVYALQVNGARCLNDNAAAYA